MTTTINRARKAKPKRSSKTLVEFGTTQLAQQQPARTKLAIIVEMLSRPEGTSLKELAAAAGWQVHSVRGVLAGSLKKKGFVIERETIDGERRYRIGAAR